MDTRMRRLLQAMALTLLMGLAPLAPVQAQTAPGLEVLLAKQEITEQILRYPRALDRLDRDLMLSLGHPDAKVSFGTTVFPSWAAYTDWMMKAHQPMLGNNHRMSNVLIEVRGDKAVSETSGTATLLVKHDTLEDTYEERWMHSRYLDTWSRRSGRWAMDSRQTLIDYRRVQLVPGAVVRSSYQVAPRRGSSDPSYPLFESLR